MKRLMAGLGVLLYGFCGAACADPHVSVVPADSGESRMVAGFLAPLLKNVSLVSRPALNPDFLILVHTDFESDSTDKNHCGLVATVEVVRPDTSESVYTATHSTAVGPLRMNSPGFFLLFPQALVVIPLGLSVAVSETKAVRKLAAAGADGLNEFFETRPHISRETPQVYPDFHD